MEVAAGSDPLDAGNIPGSASGDINGDGHVDVVDVLLGFRILSGEITIDTNQMLRGDVAPLVGGVPAPDGQFTGGDVSLIMGKAIGSVTF